ncbi:hypothetical protein BGZ73_001255 [Actinomortierella ambigua]|nr:hypothetical protein BGZ73_001255 [Actinomortierella ambigua]
MAHHDTELATQALDRSKFSNKLYYWLLAGILVQAFIYSFEVNLMYNCQPYVMNLFSATSLIAILPTILQVVSAALVPFFTKISDVVGRFQSYSVAMVCYVLGYIIQGTSSLDNFNQFAAGQVFFAIGTAGMQTLTQVLIADTTPLINRGIVFAMWDMGSAVNIWTTQLLIAPLTSPTFNWHNIYLIVALLAAAGAIVALVPLFLVQRAIRKTGQAPPKRSIGWFLHEFDTIGALLLTATLSLILFPIILANTYEDNWRTPVIYGCLIGGLISLILLVIWEAKFTDRPIMPMRIWIQRTCFGGLIVQFVLTMMASSNWAYFTSYLVVSRDLTFDQAFLLERGYQMAYLVFALGTGYAMKRFNTSRPFVWVGIVLATVGTGLMIPARQPDSSDAFVVISQTIVGAGGGMAALAASVSVTGVVHRRDIAIVIGATQILSAIAAAVGGALAGGVWTQLLPKELREHVTGEIDMSLAINRVDYVAALPEPTKSQVITAYGDSQMVLSIISCCMAVLACAAAFMMQHVDLLQSQEEQDKIYGDDGEASIEEPKEKL